MSVVGRWSSKIGLTSQAGGSYSLRHRGLRLAAELQDDVFVRICKEISAALLGFWVGLMGAYALFHHSMEFPRDGSPVENFVSLPARGMYGPWLEPGAKNMKVEFHFSYVGDEELLFHFVPGWVQEMSQVVIRLNDIPIGYLSPCRRGWGIEQRLVLHKNQLVLGPNRISFSPPLANKRAERWFVRDLYVTPVQSHSLKEESAWALLVAAERIFREGQESPSQLPRAQRLSRQAINAFRLEGKEVPLKAIDLKREILKAEKTLFVQSMSEARKAIGLGDVTQARSIYSRLLSEWVDLSELQRNEVKQALAELSP